MTGLTLKNVPDTTPSNARAVLRVNPLRVVILEVADCLLPLLALRHYALNPLALESLVDGNVTTLRPLQA